MAADCRGIRRCKVEVPLARRPLSTFGDLELMSPWRLDNELRSGFKLGGVAQLSADPGRSAAQEVNFNQHAHLVFKSLECFDPNL